MARLTKVLLLGCIYLSSCLLAVIGYFAYGKLTYSARYCGGFGKVDADIGWVIAPDADACMTGRVFLSNDAPWYDAKVFSDRNGFRAAVKGAQTSRGGILAVGDSWTFGWGVSFEDSYPGQLQQADAPVVIAASPAYGSAQALMLAERWIDRLAPRAIVYLDLGLWERSACRGTRRPTVILKPCYWQAAGTDVAELVAPSPGTVDRFASWGIVPGGMLGVGEDGWRYFLLARPLANLQQLLVRANLISGFGHDFYAVGVDTSAIQRGVLAHLARIAANVDVPVLLIDPNDIYAVHFAAIKAPPSNLYRIGAEAWRRAVGEPAARLPPARAIVPNDGHFGAGTNALIAAFLREQLRGLGVAL
jgi:hypothetical protein